MSVAYPKLPEPGNSAHATVAIRPTQSVIKAPNNSRNNETFFEQFYRMYCTELRAADQEREEYKKNHPEWKTVFDDEYAHPKKGLLAMNTGDPNGHVRVRRLREFAKFIVEDVKDPADKIYTTTALMDEIQTASEEEDNEFPLPKPVIDEVFNYADRKGDLTDKYYEYENGEWISVAGQPDFKQDRRRGAGDEPHIEKPSPATIEVPTFLASIYESEEATNLFKSMLKNPLDKGIADEYSSKVNTAVAKKAKEMEFGRDVTLPLSRLRGIVMTCANMHSIKEGMGAQAKKGKDVRLGETDLASIQNSYSGMISGGKGLLEASGCPSAWAGHLDAAVLGLSEDHRKTKQGSIFTDQELQSVLGQHGGSMTESAHTDLTKKMQDAEDIAACTDSLALAAAKRQKASKTRETTKPGSASHGISKNSNKRRTPNSLPSKTPKQLTGPSDPTSQEGDTNDGSNPAANGSSDGDTAMGGTEADEAGIQNGRSGLDASNDSSMGREGQPRENSGTPEHRNEGSEQGGPVEDPILPADMEWYRSTYDRATPLIEQIFDKPRLAQEEPGQGLAAINREISARLAQDQEKMDVSESPSAINVRLQVPIKEFLTLMIRGTHELVNTGKLKVSEIEEGPLISAYQGLQSTLDRAQQPDFWYKCLGELVEKKAEEWRNMDTEGDNPRASEYLWDEEFEDLVNQLDPEKSLESATQSANAEVFADSERQEGKIGGFRVASRKRDGTEHYQVLVQVGVYGEAQKVQGTLWHINAASMYRDNIVEDYKKSGGTQITSLDGGIGELRAHDLSSVQISGIAVIPRTTAKGYRKMPTMFIQGSVDDGNGPVFWSRTYMGRVWGQNAVIRKIRDFTDNTGMPVLTNDAQQPNLLMPEGASKRTCKAWGVPYIGRVESTRGEDITNDRDGDLGRNDGVYDQDGGFVVVDEEPPLDPTSEEFRKADKGRRMEELEVELARLKESMKEVA